jgi:hypothetical protein
VVATTPHKTICINTGNRILSVHEANVPDLQKQGMRKLLPLSGCAAGRTEDRVADGEIERLSYGELHKLPARCGCPATACAATPDPPWVSRTLERPGILGGD